MTDEYPFEGCCEHTSNAHSRRHCLLCDCERRPVQVASVPVPPPPPSGLDVHVCGVCRALTLAEDREGHADWHEGQLRTLTNILISVRALRRLARRVLGTQPDTDTTTTTPEVPK